MRRMYLHCFIIVFACCWVQDAWAGASARRSSVQSFSHIRLTLVEETDSANLTDLQGTAIRSLGPVVATSTIDSDQGFYTATAEGSAGFFSPDRGAFLCDLSYKGERADGDIDAQLYSHTLNGIFQYDFIIPSDGSINITGVLLNGGPSSINYFATVEVLGESRIGSGFDQTVLQESIRDLGLDSESFDLNTPLALPSGSYRLQIRLAHSGLGQLEARLSTGSLSAIWNILSDSQCPPDLNDDGQLDFIDISAFINAFIAHNPIADLNTDDQFDFLDITEFVEGYIAGCPGKD
jgi:hypothetical protein